jgi:CRP-like cAMP-binding protein
MHSKDDDAARLTIHAVYPWHLNSAEKSSDHWSADDHNVAQSAQGATLMRFKKGQKIFQANDAADAAFKIINGTVTAYRVVRGDAHVLTFLRSGDLFGLSVGGRYVNSTRAATAVVARKLPFATGRVVDDRGKLDVIAQLSEELRAAQHHIILLSQRKAVTRLAMFLEYAGALAGGTGRIDVGDSCADGSFEHRFAPERAV